jgi:ribonucleoside-diphosphate reductase alpha chain
MKVIKRNGKLEDVKFDEITKRLKNLSTDLSIDPIKIAKLVCAQISDNITTRELDELSANICASLSIQEPQYDILGTRIYITSHNKENPFDFVDAMKMIQENKDILQEKAPLLDDEYYQFILDHEEKIKEHYKNCVMKNKMFQMSMFGWKTLYRSYLLKSNHKVIERPEHLFYRVALFLHLSEWDKVEETFICLIKGEFIHATPTLYHAGTKRPQLSSCFLLGTNDDVSDIFKTISDVAKISKWAGGIGIHISNIRCKNSYIRGTNGYSNGILPMLRVYNDTSRYIDQCIDGKTLVYTKNGMKPIYQLKPKIDSIYQKNGHYEVLDKLLEHSYQGDFYSLSIQNNILKITSEHPIYGRHSKDQKEPYWIDVEDLTIGDEIAFPVPKYVESTLPSGFNLFKPPQP